MEIAEIILRYLGVFLAWPVIILILVVIFLKWFKAPITDFIKRLVKVEAYGSRAVAISPSEQQKKAKETLQTKSKSDIENNFRDNPNLVVAEYSRLFNWYVFEHVFNIIFGTQIDLLEHLSNKGDKGEKYINLAGFYNEFVGRAGTTSYQMNDYLGFLIIYKFLIYEGEGSELNVKITPYGVDFLSYIKTNYSVVYKYKQF